MKTKLHLKPTVVEWLALWSSVQQFAGSIPALGLGVCSGSESTLSSRSRSNKPTCAKTDRTATNKTKPHIVMFRWLKVFLWDWSYFLALSMCSRLYVARHFLCVPHIQRALTATIPENVVAIEKILIRDNQCTESI